MYKDKQLFIYRSGAGGDLRGLNSEVDAFYKKHQEQGIVVVNFFDDFINASEMKCQIFKWRESLSYEEMFPIWEDSYAEIERIHSKLNIGLINLVSIFYHDIAFDIWKRLVFFRLVSKQVEPTIYLLPNHWGKLNYDSDQDWKNNNKSKTTFLLIKLLLVAQVKVISDKVIKQATGLGIAVKRKQMISFLISGVSKDHIRNFFKKLSKFYLVYRDWVKYIFSSFLEFFPNICSQYLNIGNDHRRKNFVSGSPIILIVLEDSGSRVNLEPAMRIAEELVSRDEEYLIVTSSQFVENEVRSRFHPVLKICNRNFSKLSFILSFIGALIPFEINLFSKGISNTKLGFFTQAWLASFFLSMLSFQLSVQRALDSLNKNRAISVVLTIYEALPLSVAVGNWAKNKGVPWVGYFPILVGHRPDANYFPASKHLVYGEQLRSFMIEKNCNGSSIIVTGSPTFDNFFGRDISADRADCLDQFPGIGDKKLVVVATEAFPDPLTELAPVINELISTNGIYIVLKVHPSDSIEFFKDYISQLQGGSAIQVVGQCNLASLLNTADLLICIVSNIIVSAAVMGTPTLVCDFSNKRHVIDFVESGLSEGCFDPNELRNSIQKILFDPETRLKIIKKLRENVYKFNGYNDGNSSRRIVDQVISFRK